MNKSFMNIFNSKQIAVKYVQIHVNEQNFQLCEISFSNIEFI